MFAKSSIIFTILAVSARIASAQTPPACLLAAVNTQPNPADLEAVCGNATEVENTIGDICDDNTKAAMSAFSSVCSSAGVTISTSSASSSASSTMSSHSHSSTATGSMTGSASMSLSTGMSGSGSGNVSTIVYTSTYFDTVCSCTKTASMTTTGYTGSTGILTATYPSGTGSSSSGSSANSTVAHPGSGAVTGSGSGSSRSGSASGTSSASVATFTGAAGRVEIGGYAMGALAIAGLVMGL